MATPTFHPLRIREVCPETADAITVTFEVPPALRDAYRFTQGQYLTLRAAVAGEELRRSYSICVGVGDYERESRLQVAIKRVHGGRFSNWANERLRAGESIDVMTPDGRFFTPIDPSARRHYLGFAGGSGITPMLSLVSTILAGEPGSRFTLIYGNRTVASIMFIEALEALKNRYLERLRLVHVISDEPQEIALFSGLLDEARCRALVDALMPAGTIDHAFICGPEPMMAAADAALAAAGVSAANVSIERFGVPAPSGAPRKPLDAGEAGARADVTIVIDGKARSLRVPFDGAAILDAGIAAGANLPYACKAGVCCTCRARVLEGEVRMDRNSSLEPWELERGFVLTCQSHPVSERVVVSYDER